MIENDCLGPKRGLGITLNQLRWIKTVLEETNFLNFFYIFSSVFEAILARFCRFSHMKRLKNKIFSKLSLVSQIRITESWIWSHTVLPWSRLT